MHINALRSPKLTTLVAALALTSCADRHAESPDAMRPITNARDLERVDTVGPWDVARPMSDTTTRMKVNYMGNMRTVFNDSNYIHWAAADSVGIVPLSGLKSHWQLRRPLVKITSCRDFFIEPLTHSVPYLVPEAADAIHEIGRRFTDSVAARDRKSVV